jgi:hypothetical protein
MNAGRGNGEFSQNGNGKFDLARVSLLSAEISLTNAYRVSYFAFLTLNGDNSGIS